MPPPLLCCCWPPEPDVKLLSACMAAAAPIELALMLLWPDE